MRVVAATMEMDFLNIQSVALLEYFNEDAHQIYMQRQAEGAYNLLIERHLEDDEMKFVKYFRLSSHLFHYVLNIIEDTLIVAPTNKYPRPISPKEKLCITLRYVYFIIYNIY